MRRITSYVQITKLSFIIALFAFSSITWAQINDGGSPVKSFTMSDFNKTRIPVIEIPSIDLEKIQAEDEIEDAEGMKAPRFAVLVPMKIGFSDGVWTNLPNGDRIWRAHIKTDKAKATSLYFDDFFMPKGATLHVYSPDKVQVLGGFGAHNNKEHNMFVTSLIYGNEQIIEYYEPFMSRNQGRISISEVSHAYRMIENPYELQLRGFGDSNSLCQVNVNCSEGTGKEEQRDAVARISVRTGFSLGWCSGTLLNNVRQDCTPYFLAALHCADDGNGDIAPQSDFNQWVFYFNYQSTGCANPLLEGEVVTNNTITGADIKAHSSDPTISTGSDLLLVEFQNSIPETYNVFYAGWDRGTDATTGGYGIHHPSGDIKKISTFTETTGTQGWNQAGVTHHTLRWVATANGHGITEGGSSGSALFNNDGQVIGNLSGGSTLCSDLDNPARQDVYGKMSYHWDSNGTIALYRLKDWLDPDNTGAVTLDGVYFPCLVATDPYDAGVSAITNPIDQSLLCENPFAPEVVLTNFGTETLTSVTINYQIDAGTVNTYDWTGSILSLGTEIVTLPSISAPAGGFPFVLQAYTSMPNGILDADSSNDTSSVSSQYNATTAIPYSANFAGLFPFEISVVDPDNDSFTWDLDASVNGFGTGDGVGSMVMDNWTNNTIGTQDYAFLPSYDFSSVTGAFLEFDLAYAQYFQDPDEFSDGLGILVSSDCGETFNQEYFETGAALATAPSLNGFFTPASDQWVTKTIDLSAYDGISNVQIVIVNVGNYSQALYIDNINVNAASLSVEDEQLIEDLIVYPNPTRDILNIKSSVQLEKIELYNILGERLLTTEETSQINVKNFASGVYLLNVYSSNSKSVKRVIIE